MKIRDDIARADVTYEFATEIRDLQRESLHDALAGSRKPEDIVGPEPETMEQKAAREMRQSLEVTEMRLNILNHISFGKFRIAELGGEIIGFAMSMPRQLTPFGAVRQSLLRAKSVVKLTDLHVRPEFQDPFDVMAAPYKLGEAAIAGYDPSTRVIAFAAEEDHFQPEVLRLMEFTRHPAHQKGRQDRPMTLDQQVEPLTILKYEQQTMASQV